MPEILVIAETLQGTERSVSSEVCQVADDITRRRGWRWAKLRVAAEGDIDETVQVIADWARKAQVVLMGATATGKDTLSRVAGILSVPLAQDCIGCSAEGQVLTFTRSLYGGKVLCDMVVKAQPALATIRPRTATPYEGLVETIGTIESGGSVPRLQIHRSQVASRAVDVSEAEIVVSGGRGMQGPEHWHILEDLVGVLGPRAALACSRPVSDDGWRPRAEHVGQTGRTISPEVYIAAGISGATQHVAGIRGSKHIIAINRDPDAPIFTYADYGIVGDLFEVVPAMTQAIRAVAERSGASSGDRL